MGKRLTKEDFIRKAKLVHSDKYDYSKVHYVNNSTKVQVGCPVHGSFYQTPANHLWGFNCRKCADQVTANITKQRARDKRNWNFEQPEDYKLIPLTKGKFAMVDNEDFDRVKDIPWLCNVQGYAVNTSIGLMHRIILNAPRDMEVDHVVQSQTLDNRRSNIRIVTKSQNGFNSRPQKGSSSIYKGVGYREDRRKWRAFIGTKHIGNFNTELEASIARDIEAMKIQGEYAYLNHPEKKEEYLEIIRNSKK